MCHGAPGVKPKPWVVLTPDPPDLSTAVRKWTDAQLYWIVKHGIKMSGMPAFGPSHSEEELWGIVAFLRKLPGMAPEEYERLTGHQGGGHTH